MTLLLDTHAFVWWTRGGDALSKAQKRCLAAAEAEGRSLAIAAITLWELAKLIERGRLVAHEAVDVLFDRIESQPSLVVLPLSPRVALESTRLGATAPRDPADQLIVATARVHGLPLVTADERIRRAGLVAVV